MGFVRRHVQLLGTLLVVLASKDSAVAFLPTRNPLVDSMTRHNGFGMKPAIPCRPTGNAGIRSTELQSTYYSVVASSLSKVSPPVRLAFIVGAALVAITKRRQILYPGTEADPNVAEPLPEGSFGCPFVGGNFMKGTREKGPGLFFREKAAEAGNPRIFKYMMMGKPSISVSGMKNVKAVFSKEFKSHVTVPRLRNLQKIFGTNSLIMCPNSEEHNFLRRLVGQAMTPEAISKAIPSLAQTANEQIDVILQSSEVTMEKVVTNFTLDVAWRQIIGLDLQKEAIPDFYKAVNEWIGGILSPRVMFLPGTEKTKAGKAHAYLVSLIESKLDALEAKGPDGSTISGMMFAVDEEQSKRLTRGEIIDNCLLLILAGTETAASTLTVATCLLGLHPTVFEKLRHEQESLIAKVGTTTLSREQLDKECPYLDAVVKETMRLKPLASGGAMRTALETMVIEGKQIPKGYGVSFNIPLTHENDPVVREEDGSHMDVVKGFRPERWLDDATRPTEFMPFGYGPRFCLGANLAMAEMKVFLALFSRRVDFDLVNMSRERGVTWKKQSIIPKPEDGTVIAPRPAKIMA